MLRVVALHALPRSKAHVHRTPRGQVRGESTHIGLRSAAAAEARRDLRIPGLVQQPCRANRIQFCADRIERLFPGDWHEPGVFVAPLARIGALHRLQHTVRVVQLLHEAVRLDADFSATRMDLGGAEIRLDLGRDAVAHLHGQQVGPCDALVAVCRDAGHGGAAAFSFFCLRRFLVCSTSTTKRAWRPRQISSTPSLA